MICADARLLLHPYIDDELDVAQRGEDPVARILRCLAHHPDHVVAAIQQELAEVGAVLAGDPGDEGARHGLDRTDPRCVAAPAASYHR